MGEASASHLENFQVCQTDLGAREGYRLNDLECNHTAHTGQQRTRRIQHGFRKGKSSLTKVIPFYDEVTH